MLFLLFITPLRAQENETAYEALRVVGMQLGRGALNHIVSITGVKGSPQPEKWKIVLEDPEGRGVRQLAIAGGKIDSDDTSDRRVAGSAEGATIDVSHLNLDSSGAFEVANHTAEASHTAFATIDYTLRTDERGEPVWILTLLNRSSRPVGTIYIGATRGIVNRTGRVERHRDYSAHVDTDCWQDSPDAESVDQPLLARHPVCHRARSDDFANSIRCFDI